MSEFAAQSGVSTPTIKHYLREGLLPEPVRTSRNMAYYDAALIPRVRRIKSLQRRLFLPLHAIREILEAGIDELPDTDIALERSIADALKESTSQTFVPRSELEAQGNPKEELDFFSGLGLITSTVVGGVEGFANEDVDLLVLLRQARSAGLREDMLPPGILADYAKAIGNLVRLELTLFREGVLPRAGEDLPQLATAATSLSERLVVLLRRKLLLPTLRQLIAEQPEDP